MRRKARAPGRPARAVLPGGLDDAGNLSLKRQLAEAQAADAELAQKCPGASAELAAVMLPALEFRLAGVLHSFCSRCHIFSVLNRNQILKTSCRRAYAAVRNGMPNCLSSARAELSSFADVTIV